MSDNTEKLPQRINKAERHAAQEKAAKEEQQTGWSVGGREKSHPDGWFFDREA